MVAIMFMIHVHIDFMCFLLFSYMPLLKTFYYSLACKTNISLHNSCVPAFRVTIVQYRKKNGSVLPYGLYAHHDIEKRLAEFYVVEKTGGGR